MTSSDKGRAGVGVVSGESQCSRSCLGEAECGTTGEGACIRRARSVGDGQNCVGQGGVGDHSERGGGREAGDRGGIACEIEESTVSQRQRTCHDCGGVGQLDGAGIDDGTTGVGIISTATRECQCPCTILGQDTVTTVERIIKGYILACGVDLVLLVAILGEAGRVVVGVNGTVLERASLEVNEVLGRASPDVGVDSKDSHVCGDRNVTGAISSQRFAEGDSGPGVNAPDEGVTQNSGT